MICIVNTAGLQTLTNEKGTSFTIPLPLIREAFRADIRNKDDLKAFLDKWGADEEGTRQLLDDDFDLKYWHDSLANVGLSIESLRDLTTEYDFFSESRGKAPVELVLHPSELGTVGTFLAKQGTIADDPFRPRRDEAARAYLQAHFNLTDVRVEEQTPLGGFR